MFENLKNFIKNLQAADEAKKKRWLFVLSAIAMILVISSWVVYLNKAIINLKLAEQTEKPAMKISKESPWQVFLTGLKAITAQTKELITATRKISIEGSRTDLIPENFEKIPNATSTLNF